MASYQIIKLHSSHNPFTFSWNILFYNGGSTNGLKYLSDGRKFYVGGWCVVYARFFWSSEEMEEMGSGRGRLEAHTEEL